MNNVLVIGDSWSSAIESDTGLNQGWPTILNIDQNLKQALAGSTAQQWRSDFDGRLTKAIQTPADTVIMSIMGNDLIGLISSGNISFASMSVAFTSMQYVTQHFYNRNKLIVILYSDPFCGNRPDVKIAVPIMNAAIVNACPKSTVFLHSSDFLTLDDFNGSDIHPKKSGHVKIASELQKIIN